MRNICCAAALLCSCSMASAETLPVAGVYAANADLDTRIHTLAVEGFGGDAGPELSFLLTDLLTDVEIEGKTWFSILPAATLGNQLLSSDVPKASGDVENGDAQVPRDGIAVLRGTARSLVNDYSIAPKEVKTCAKKVDKKCVERTVEVFECRAMSVNYTPSLRVIAPNGDLLYSNSEFLDSTQSYCEDEDNIPDPNEMLASLATDYAYSVRLDLAPQYRSGDVRILERRKGLSKEDARSFKAAVRLTKSDPFASCAAFNELESANPDHLSVVFNTALCRESEGDLVSAREYYLRALSIRPGKSEIKASLRRIEDRIQAKQQVADHFGTY